MRANSAQIGRLILAVLFGALFSFGYEPYSFWWAPLLALILMIILSKLQPLKLRLGLWYCFGLGFLGPLLHWTSIYVGSMPWIILILGQSCFFALVGLGFTKSKFEPLLFSSLFAIAEFLRASLPFGGFGWGRLGFSQLEGPLQGWLRIGGVAIVGWVGSFVAFALVNRQRAMLFAAIVLVLAPLGISIATAAKLMVPAENFRVGLIQGGVSQLGLEFNATPEEVFNRHFAETESLLKSEKVDLILWPENASDIDPITNLSIAERINSVVDRSQASLVIGAVLQSPQGPENVSLHYQPKKGLVSTYQKRDLVPFGEYVPLRNFTRKFSSLVDTVKDFVPGHELSVHKIGRLTFSPLICFEVLDDEVVRDALSISNIGVIQTNNATFGRSPQSAQQYQMSRVRAYEYRLPLLVAATTGRTALISSEGKTLRQLPNFQSGYLVVDVSPTTASPPPLRSREIFIFSSVISFFFLAMQVRRMRLGRISK